MSPDLYDVFHRPSWTPASLWEYALLCIYSPRSRIEYSVLGAARVAGLYPHPNHLVNHGTVAHLQVLLRDQRFPKMFSERTMALAHWITAHDALGQNLSREVWATAPGMGPKVASMYVCYTQELPAHETPIALDIHVLRWMQRQGIDCPLKVDAGKRYLALEQQFRDLAMRMETDPRQLHYEVWLQGVRSYRKVA